MESEELTFLPAVSPGEPPCEAPASTPRGTPPQEVLGALATPPQRAPGRRPHISDFLGPPSSAAVTPPQPRQPAQRLRLLTPPPPVETLRRAGMGVVVPPFSRSVDSGHIRAYLGTPANPQKPQSSSRGEAQQRSGGRGRTPEGGPRADALPLPACPPPEEPLLAELASAELAGVDALLDGTQPARALPQPDRGRPPDRGRQSDGCAAPRGRPHSQPPPLLGPTEKSPRSHWFSDRHRRGSRDGLQPVPVSPVQPRPRNSVDAGSEAASAPGADQRPQETLELLRQWLPAALSTALEAGGPCFVPHPADDGAGSQRRQECHVTPHQPEDWRRARAAQELSDPDLGVLLSQPVEHVGKTAGRSGQFFLRSADGRVFHKTLPAPELSVLRRILPDYVRHLTLHRWSLLQRMLGTHTIKVTPRPGAAPIEATFMTILNVFDPERPLNGQYDLKGSLFNREVGSRAAAEVARKDNDWRLAGCRIALAADLAGRLLEALAADVLFLQGCGLMDYSLLVGVADDHPGEVRQDGGFQCGEVQVSGGGSLQTTRGGVVVRCGGVAYFLGLIDLLQEYNVQKRVERRLKAVLHPSVHTADISSAPPDVYACRFIAFVRDLVLDADAMGLSSSRD
eukprot:TRINITY_DN15523_c0_g1_i1.p1 TRINITY_DN15523_c0_g1~~TRINITY_DN15523_c0_g1_i1.p1  ORF type:complete len:662 (+),score=140.86 TRINITY_DN15523_c0_g1_i1:114-1988(+)